MKKFTILILMYLTFNFSFAQNIDGKDRYYVINILGAKLYEEPSFEANVLKELEVGEELLPYNILPTPEALEVGENFKLSGSWVLTEIEGVEGYVFSSNLSKREPNILEEYYGKRIDLFGKLLKTTSETKLVKVEPGVFPMEVETKFYENGTYYYSSFDSCFDHVKTYKNLDIHEVYHQMISDYAGYSSGREGHLIPKPIEYSQNVIKFEEIGATMDLTLEILDNGNFKVSSSDCT